MALRVESDSPQSVSGGFELQGSAQEGELALFSPLGQIVALLRWRPGVAELVANGNTSTYAALDDLATAATGTSLPIGALFAWLNGDAAPAAGWTVDLSRRDDGRLNAQRRWPLPAADLRIALDR